MAAVRSLVSLDASASSYLVDSTVIGARHLPALYRALLEPDDSMTARLERYFGRPLRVDMLLMSSTDGCCIRWVAMRAPTDRCLAIAGVSLAIDSLSDGLQTAVLQGEQPLGRLLTQHGLEYKSIPTAFL